MVVLFAIGGAGVAATKMTTALASAANRRRRPLVGGLELPDDDLVVTTDDGARLAVTVEGDGPPVVLVHGWACDRSVWNDVTRRLVSDGHRVIRHDVRGHGRSSLGTGGLGIDRLITDLVLVMEGTGAQDAVLVGHSLGSTTAIAHLCRAGESGESAQVRAVVLVSAGVPAEGVLSGGAARVSEWAMRSPVIEWLLARDQLGLELINTFVGGGTRDLDDLRATRAMLVATPGAVRSDLLATIQFDFRALLSGVTVPATVMVGSLDTLARPANAAELVDRLPGARLIELTDKGHNLPLEAPDEVAAIVHGVAVLG